MADRTGLQYTFVANTLSPGALTVAAFELREGKGSRSPMN